MPLYDVFALLLVAAAVFGYLNHRILRLPSTIGLMVLALLSSLILVGLGRLEVGGVLQIVTAVKQIDFHDVLMQVMLSFLLFAGAIHVDAGQLGQLRRQVGSLAVFGTLISTAVVGLTMFFVLPLLGLPLPLLYCLLFGALISPTDPIAVLGILTQAGIPKDLETKIVGESLFNDGVGVVVFVAILQLITAGDTSPDAGQLAILFAHEALGGVALGIALGYGTSWLLRTIDHYKVEVLITLALVTGGTALATNLHTSAPLAMVVAGLIVGNNGRTLGMSDTTREYVDKFWELLDEILNAVLFVLIGLEMLVVQFEKQYFVAGIIAIVVVLLARLVAVTVPTLVLRQWADFTNRSLPVLTWGGLRGGISVALALSLPPSPARDILVAVTYIVVVFSILVQGLTIGPLVQRLGLGNPNAAPAPH
ncbi:sodium:proton antiporter [Hymenobacter koreensis]|uniref:Sodium:proton antiporter n=1 Tax=Hymenobacter koreensis TaxID=1084523 RepID=A0ABP8J3M7_9BACT